VRTISYIISSQASFCKFGIKLRSSRSSWPTFSTLDNNIKCDFNILLELFLTMQGANFGIRDRPEDGVYGLEKGQDENPRDIHHCSVHLFAEALDVGR